MHTLRHSVHKDVPRLLRKFFFHNFIGSKAPNGGAGSFAEHVTEVSGQLFEDLMHGIVSGVEVMQMMNSAPGGSSFRAVAPFAFTSTIGLEELLAEDNISISAESLLGRVSCEQVYSLVQTPQTWLDHQVEEDKSTGDLIFNFDFLAGRFPIHVMEGIVNTYEHLYAQIVQYLGQLA